MTVSTGREFEAERHYSMLSWIVVVVIAIVGVVFYRVIKRIIDEDEIS
jgi:hypothetical protein